MIVLTPLEATAAFVLISAIGAGVLSFWEWVRDRKKPDCPLCDGKLDIERMDLLD